MSPPRGASPVGLPSMEHAEPDQLAQFASDVRRGLTASSKHLPPRWLYDALGSVLFEAITLIPEYYLTRTEQAILDARVDDILGHLDGRHEVTLVELGSGSSRKTRTIIRALLARQGALTYCPIDISEDALVGAGGLLTMEFPLLTYKPVVGQYRMGLASLRDDGRRKLILFIGSSIGNFDPPEATRLLRDVADTMGPEDRVLLGADLDKDPAVIQAAYGDAMGVTRAFNMNLLARMNRELGADFELTAFDHRARFNPAEHRMEMYLVSLRAQEVRLGALDLSVRFAEGEEIHTENSYKYTPSLLGRIVRDAGLEVEASWHDPQRWFALHLLAPRP